MVALILGTAALAGSLAGAAVSVGVYWKTVEFLIRHSRYRNQANGKLFTKGHA